MLDRALDWLYERLGRKYWVVLAIGQATVSIFVVVASLAGIALFLRPSFHHLVVLAIVGSILAIIATTGSTLTSRSVYDLIEDWHDDPNPSHGKTVTAWRAASTLVLTQYRRRAPIVNSVIVLPILVLAIVLLHLGWFGSMALLLAVIAPAVWGTFLSYSSGEHLARPIVSDLATALPVEFPFAKSGLPISLRLKISLPAYTVISAMAAAAVVSGTRGASGLITTTLVSAAVGGLMATELAVLLCRSIVAPMERLGEGMRAVRSGDYSVRVPVMTSDEIGELSHDFNRMAYGLAEREEMREAFGTYVDRSTVELILSGKFPPEGIEVDVSILFTDVQGFTSYAEHASARDVIATLNEQFELMVPIIERHGGHVDKFIGDGMMAVFGAPEFFPDHADRAVDVAIEIVEALREQDHLLPVGLGVNSGMVVAGSVGGAGRLNFSVIGDTVNTAARVEAATRSTGDQVLVAQATKERLTRHEVISRGSLPLKGKSEPVELFALEALAGEERWPMAGLRRLLTRAQPFVAPKQ
ncbi:MAG TPA: adenylate/guanylate cyclase domain-containing protein [Aeromicrobium sp.]|nr:adenylate/guanylate cyclase domain-containing protein [Aeromicrobium sp.]